MDQKKLSERARKLLALAQRGEGGEARNADRMLQDLMKRTGIRMEDIDSQAQVERQFKTEGDEHTTFLCQVISSVAGKDRRIYRYTKERGLRYCELTTAEHLEIELLLQHYWPLWKRERKRSYSAFIQANRLFAKAAEGQDERVYSDEELEEMRRVMQLAQMARVESPNKRLERPEKLA